MIGIFLQNLACSRNKLENAKPRGCYAADLSKMRNDFPRRSLSVASGRIACSLHDLSSYLDSAAFDQWRPAGYAKSRPISPQGLFAGDGRSDLRWVNELT